MIVRGDRRRIGRGEHRLRWRMAKVLLDLILERLDLLLELAVFLDLILERLDLLLELVVPRSLRFPRREVAWAALNANAKLLKVERAEFVGWDARRQAAGVCLGVGTSAVQRTKQTLYKRPMTAASGCSI